MILYRRNALDLFQNKYLESRHHLNCLLSMFNFLCIYTIVLLPCLSLSQTFLPFGSYEYYIERNNPVWSYSESEGKCNASNATLAVVNTEDIRNHLVVEIGNLTGKTTKVIV